MFLRAISIKGHTLLPIIRKYEEKYHLNKPIVIADSGLLSKDKITMLDCSGYKYIIGARIKNESKPIKERMLSEEWIDGHSINIKRGNGL